jgi:hypothetical protein
MSCFHRIAFKHLVEPRLEGDQARIIGSIVNFLNAAHHIGVERETSGAAIIPATAPIAAANPQPKADIRPTRMPTSRLDTGFRAAARIANPRSKAEEKEH